MRTILSLGLVAWFAGGAPALAKDPSALCAPLRALADDAARAATPRNVTFFKLAPMEVACSQREDDPLSQAYCQAAIEVSGVEFSHRYPREILACLRAEGMRPAVAWAREYTGFTDGRKLVHVAARRRDGVVIDVRFEPEPDEGASEELRNYYGRYEMTIWAAPR
jgi:hypothetical protein